MRLIRPSYETYRMWVVPSRLASDGLVKGSGWRDGGRNGCATQPCCVLVPRRTPPPSDSNDPELKLRTEDGRLTDLTRAASDCFEWGDVDGAARHYCEILQLFPNDPVATVMLRDLSPILHPKSAIE